MGKLLLETIPAVEPMFYDNYGLRGIKRERIMAIEYRLEKPDLYLPFQVFTTGTEEDAGKWYSLYDFDWCKRDEMLYYHNSGGGGSRGFYIHRFDPKRKEPFPGALWWDRSITMPTDGGRTDGRKLSDATVQRWGYKILPAPVMVETGWQVDPNPFTPASEGETEYCSRCDDHLPTDQLCDHIWCCEKCGHYSKPGDRCKHRR